MVTSFAFTAVTIAVGNITKCFQCFKEGTLVETEEGTKPIEEIQVGDKVLAYDEETGEQEYREVTRLFRNETREWYHIRVNGEEIVCTGGHPFYIPMLETNRERVQYEGQDKSNWVRAKDLKVSDKVLLSGGEYGIIEAVEVTELDEPETTYNFEVEGYHTYYVGTNGVLCHNMCAKINTSESANNQDTAVIGKMKDLNEYQLQPGEYRVADMLPDQGNPKANWKQNSRVLRSIMKTGNSIRDVSAYPMKNAGFLGLERNLLLNHGWIYYNGFWFPGG